MDKQYKLRKQKIILIFALGIGLCLFSTLHTGSGAKQSVNRDRLFAPYWNGNAVVIAETDGDVARENPVSIPPQLRPLFFQPIPINEAGFDLLLTVPGIGPATARSILDKRKFLGRFDSSEQLLLISGIGEKKKKILSGRFSFSE